MVITIILCIFKVYLVMTASKSTADVPLHMNTSSKTYGHTANSHRTKIYVILMIFPTLPYLTIPYSGTISHVADAIQIFNTCGLVANSCIVSIKTT